MGCHDHVRHFSLRIVTFLPPAIDDTKLRATRAFPPVDDPDAVTREFLAVSAEIYSIHAIVPDPKSVP
jgi:hypothetical protein